LVDTIYFFESLQADHAQSLFKNQYISPTRLSSQ